MPRIKLSEFRAKQLVSTALGLDYQGWEVTEGVAPRSLSGNRFVVKVDQAVKQRFKRGLLKLNVAKKDLNPVIKELSQSGYSSFIIEPFQSHTDDSERYISFSRERQGILVRYSQQGGVDIEAHPESITEELFDDANIAQLANSTGFSDHQLAALRQLLDTQHISFLEINPYLAKGSQISLLDVAIEVDSTASLLVDGWTDHDIRSAAIHTTPEEEAVRALDSESPASFNLEVIDPNGSIFLLLSGGGASIVVADEFYARGFGKKLANYGEYSGNPNQYEAKHYTDQVLSLLLKSTAPQKVLFIGGAVANFTDIKATFSGIINSLRQHKAELRKQAVNVYVRRGGPNQRVGLGLMEAELADMNLLGAVNDPSTSIPAAVDQVLKGFK